MTTTVTTRAAHIPAVAVTGAGLVVAAVMLYATELSRAVAVTMLPFAACLFGAALFARVRGHWPSRAWRVAFAILIVAALAYGVWLYIYGLTHPPMSA